MTAMEDSILELVRFANDSLAADIVHSALQRELGIRLSQSEFDSILLGLQRKLLVRVDERGRRRMVSEYSRTVEALPHPVTREMDLEPHVEGYLWRNFHERFLDAEPQNFSLIVQNTARGGPPYGIWRRPDIVAAVVSRYTYSPIPQLDLFAFELKMPDGCKVYAVHEALAHTALAHFAYLVLYLPDGEADPRIGSGLRQISEQAQIHGIGLVIVTDAMRRKLSNSLNSTSKRA
jgi:hypothetical protein